MRTFLIAGAAFVALAGAATAQTRNLTGFTGVTAEDPVDVLVRTGETYSVSVTGRDAARIRTEVRDGTLKIRDANRPWFGRRGNLDATIHVTLPRLEELGAARGAEIEAHDITARDITIGAAMGGVIEIDGVCNALDASVAMGGVLEADDFRCATADISAAMGGVAEIYATERFDASAAMGGTIDIAGGASGETSASMGGVISH